MTNERKESKALIADLLDTFDVLFYLFPVTISSIRLITLFLYYDYDSVGSNYYVGLLGHFMWAIGLVSMIKSRTLTFQPIDNDGR